MDRKQITRLFATCALAIGPCSLPLQDLPAQTTNSRETLLEAAREIIGSARYCALVTLDESGTPRVRTMDPFPPDSAMTIWMGTHRGTRKVGDIEGDSRVTLYYASPDAAGFVTITGRARVVDDADEKAARWKPEWEAFYQNRESDYRLIQIIPETLEVVDYSRGIVGDPDTWEPPSVHFRENPTGP